MRDWLKKILAGVMAMVAFGVFAAVAPSENYTLVNDEENGYSYLQINADMDDFAFQSDFGSVGNSGKVGVFKYAEGLEGQALRDYINEFPADDAKFSKKNNGGLIEIGNVKAGDRVGFYLQRNNGDFIREWVFVDYEEVEYIDFEKNGDSGNSSHDEWITVGEFRYTALPPPPPPPSGAPLPGALAVMLVGGLFAGAKKLRHQK